MMAAGTSAKVYPWGSPPKGAITKKIDFFGLNVIFLVGLLDARHFTIQLSNDLDYNHVFIRRFYYVNNCQMRLLKWTLFFNVKEESPIIPIWIAFLNLCLHLLILMFFMLWVQFLVDRYKWIRLLLLGQGLQFKNKITEISSIHRHGRSTSHQGVLK
ncbi:hypothetical protein IEQ34_005174 [Dendrobium chrysotoxum]|uniref:DUF4283 domain-containing protein n=1 Tax=Dendrobium chrysotoxum TaxID=161865 RepID=A0AAV7H844_DENCH|nr:hypothetical protein IEQ34_005174 [Dendrobium chrysotoxum]